MADSSGTEPGTAATVQLARGRRRETTSRDDRDDDGSTAFDDQAVARTRPTLPVGSVLGRYLLLDPISSGGMGVVYEAYDPHLERRLALKLLAVEPDDDEDTRRHRERLLREAQALAQLSHPNVLAVHDVGTVGDDVFIALELVSGSTVGQWLDDERPSRARILEVFTAAGEGLAAAHRHGLIHRDIKPSNILVGADGRVRVIDFGLARAVDSTDDDSELGRALTTGAGKLATPLTRVGALMGTPRYMSPEQHRGEPADERSDQFSFCSSLYQALVGYPPFAGDTIEELARNVGAGRLEHDKADAHLPAWLRGLLRRGLAPDPALRYASMDALLDDLRRDRTLPWKWAGAGLLVAACAALAVLAARPGPPAEAALLCTDGTAAAAALWDDGDRERVRGALLATGSPRAQDTFERADRTLGDFRRSWADTRDRACAATRLRGDQSERLLDLRMSCLERRRHRAEALVDTLADTDDAGQVDRAAEAAERVADLRRCSDAEALLATVPPPEDPTVARGVREVRAQLDRAEAAQFAGRFEHAMGLATPAFHRARGLGYEPLVAAAAFRRGALQSDMGKYDDAVQTLVEAAERAARGGARDLVARAWIELFEVYGFRQDQRDLAAALEHPAQVAVDLAGASDELRGLFHQTRGLVAHRQSDYATSEAASAEAMEALGRAFGDDSTHVAGVANNYGIALLRQGRYADARVQFERSAAVMERAFGPRHPQLAGPVSNLGRIAGELGDHAEAERQFARAAAIDRESLGPDHPSLAAGVANLGITQMELGRLDAAEKSLGEALRVFERNFGDEHLYVAMTLDSLALVLALRDDHDAALAASHRALAILDETGHARSEHAGNSWLHVARVHQHKGAPRAALRAAQTGLEIYQATLGDAHPKTVLAMAVVAESLVDTGRAGEALVRARRAVDTADSLDEISASRVAAARFALARATAATGDRPAGEALAREAASDYDRAGTYAAGRERQRIGRWLAERR